MSDDLEITPETSAYLERALLKFEPHDRSVLENAITHALSVHAQQARRPSGETYGNHILRVAARLSNDFGIIDKELFIAGLYHDAIEDQVEKLCEGESVSRSNAYRFLTTHYSERVSNTVRGVSNPEDLEDIRDRNERDSKYIAHVIDECNKNSDCFLIKLSDFFDNAMRIQYNLTEVDKVRGAKKYLPLFDYFYECLEHQDVIFDRTVVDSLKQKIRDQKDYINQFI